MYMKSFINLIMELEFLSPSSTIELLFRIFIIYLKIVHKYLTYFFIIKLNKRFIYLACLLNIYNGYKK